jgi:hypothetical protein
MFGDISKHPKSMPKKAEVTQEDWRHLIQTFGKLDSADREALVNYLQSQIYV